MKLLKVLFMTLFVIASLAASTQAAMSRFMILAQMNYDTKQGLFVTIASDPADGKTAPLESAVLNVNAADGEKWYWMNWEGAKLVYNKDYEAKVKVTPDAIELMVDGTRKNLKTLKYQGADIAMGVDGLIDWAKAPTAYIVVLKALSITLQDTTKWVADLDPATVEYGKPIFTVPDWRIPEDENNFSMDFTFRLVKVE